MQIQTEIWSGRRDNLTGVSIHLFIYLLVYLFIYLFFFAAQDLNLLY